MAIRVWAVGHDTADAEKIARFLSDALRRPIRDGATSAIAAIEIADAALLLTYRQVPEVKTVKNRMHPDLISTDFAADVTRLLDLGAAQLNDVRHRLGPLDHLRRSRRQRVRPGRGLTCESD